MKYGIKYGIRNTIKISNPLNTKYLVGCVAPPVIQRCSTTQSFSGLTFTYRSE